MPTPSNELKPCPFCGNKARFWKNQNMSVVHCSNCNAGNVRNAYDSWNTDEEVINAWNTRKGDV